jgi:hypothetical protein
MRTTPKRCRCYATVGGSSTLQLVRNQRALAFSSGPRFKRTRDYCVGAIGRPGQAIDVCVGQPELDGRLQPRKATPTCQLLGRRCSTNLPRGPWVCSRLLSQSDEPKRTKSIGTQRVELSWEPDAEGRSNALPLRPMSLLLALMDRLRSSIIFRAS